MAHHNARELEYGALRVFLKITGEPQTRMEHKLADAIEEELTARQGEVVRLYYINQLPMKEVAEVLNVSISTVSRTLKRARARLHRCLKYSAEGLMSSFER